MSRRGKILEGSEFEKERDNALKEPGVEDMLKALIPAPEASSERLRQLVIRPRNASVDAAGVSSE